MGLDIVFLLVLLLVVMVVLAAEWVSVDLVAMGMALALVISGILTPREVFSGFAGEFIFVLCAIFVLSGALSRTGIMEVFARGIQRLAGNVESRAIAVIMATSAGLSAFLSNTNVTAVMLPAVMEYAHESRQSPSRLLIPLAYASMLGGSATLLGTSTNLAANALLQQVGLEPFGLFEFLPVGLAMSVVGIALMVLFGRALLPSRAAAGYARDYSIDAYMSELEIEEGSDAIGKRLGDTALTDRGISVLSVHRGESHLSSTSQLPLAAGDVLIVVGSRAGLLETADLPGIRLEATVKDPEDELTGDEETLAEAIIMPRSVFRGRTLRQLRFRERYGISVIAVHRRGQSYPIKVADIPLEVGDVLLLGGPSERLELLDGNRGLWVVGEVSHLPYRQRKGAFTLAAIVAAIVAAGFGWLPLSIALLLAVLAVVAGGVIRPEEAYQSIEWPLIILIGGMTSMGVALQKTGAADLLAQQLVSGLAPLGLPVLMAGIALLTMILTQPMSNAAAALVMLPVAISAAGLLGVDPRSLAVLVTLSASLSFIAPLEPACLLVYAPGKYRFIDFIRAGLPLTLLALVVLLVLVPIFWPL